MKPAIVVTGASSGIGRELARVAAREGSVMVLIGLAPDALDDLAAELRRSGVQAHALFIDLADSDAGQRIENKLAEIGVYCDVLVNSAGIGVFGAVAVSDRDGAAQADRRQYPRVDGADAPVSPGHDRAAPRRRAQCRLHHRLCAGAEYGDVLCVEGLRRAPSPRLWRQRSAGTGVTVTCLAPGVVRTAFFEGSEVSQTGFSRWRRAPMHRKPRKRPGARFRAGKRLVIPRLIDRIIAAVCILLPDALLLRIVSTLQRVR